MSSIHVAFPELLSVKEVARRVGLSKRTIWRYLALKKFPEPLRLSRACLRWRRGDINAFLAELHQREAQVTTAVARASG